ncbi:MAG: OadG-related small transporter subunit [Oscillospiraceae bacterium]|nr:OadG-related small transporter subunit [Oscillospiraceae bacterium]
MNTELFLQTLPIMAKGVGGIFIVMGIIYLLVTVLNVISAKNNNQSK